MNKKDYKLVAIILAIISGTILFLTKGHYLYGSTTDWITQHYRIPEYFRNLFYETHNLFPNFAFHLGAGQNIFYLSYYGLFSPIILLSYLFPFISMQNYIIGSTIISLFISIFLFYRWLRTKYNTKMTFILTCLFAFATPLLFHSHRHIMFMNYMPFLIMGFMGVDAYFEERKKILLTISVFLLIMTSYFFSVSGIVALIIYGIYKYIEINPKPKLVSFIREGISFSFPFIVAVLMSGILLFPTLYTIMSGRVEGSSITLPQLLFPKLILTDVLYGGYSFGLTSLLLLGVIVGILSKEKGIRFLSIIMALLIAFPIFIYILNGGMYINGKVLIPFLPIAIFCVGYTMQLRKIAMRELLLFILLSLFIIFMNYNNAIVYLFVLDVILTIIAVQIKNIKQITWILPIVTLIIVFAGSISSNMKDTLAEPEEYLYKEALEYINEDTTFFRTNNLYNNLYSINQVFDNDFYTISIYSSTSSPYYKDYYKNDMNNEFEYRSREILATTKNLLSNIYLGNKYIIADSYQGAGYEKEYEGKLNVYKNENVFSIGYATKNIMSEKEYESLPYPYNIDALLHYTIVKEDMENVYEPKIKKIELDTHVQNSEVEYQEIQKGYHIESSKQGSRLLLGIQNMNDLKDKILLIKFTIQNKSNIDRYITINDVKNKVTTKNWKYHNENYTFEYTLAESDISTLDIGFSKGKFDIVDIECYVLDTKDVLSIEKNMHSPLIIDKEKTKGDYIEGTIDVEYDGYFSISIPYDSGFKIFVDSKEIKYEKVNQNFIGFAIEKGEHKIQMEYTSPWSIFGKYVSCFGLIGFIVIILCQYRKTCNNRE